MCTFLLMHISSLMLLAIKANVHIFEQYLLAYSVFFVFV